MANRAIWDVRQRHIWLSTPLKADTPKLRTRKRCGLQAAMERKAPKTAPAEAAAAEQPSE